MTTIDIRDLPQRLAEMVDLASSGEEVMVVDGDVPRVRLLQVQGGALPPGRKRTLGLHPGAIVTTSDFDAPLPEEFWTGDS